MTEYQICEDYRRAKFKAKQVHILAELNLVGKKEIVDILKRNGLAVNLRRNNPEKSNRKETAEQ